MAVAAPRTLRWRRRRPTQPRAWRRRRLAHVGGGGQAAATDSKDQDHVRKMDTSTFSASPEPYGSVEARVSGQVDILNQVAQTLFSSAKPITGGKDEKTRAA